MFIHHWLFILSTNNNTKNCFDIFVEHQLNHHNIELNRNVSDFKFIGYLLLVWNIFFTCNKVGIFEKTSTNML